jgi:hypothetical protein
VFGVAPVAVIQLALAAARMALEEKPLPLHDPEDALAKLRTALSKVS